MCDMHTARISNVEIVMCVVIKNDRFYLSQNLFNNTGTEEAIGSVYIKWVSVLTGLSLRAGDWGFSLATMNVGSITSRCSGRIKTRPGRRRKSSLP